MMMMSETNSCDIQLYPSMALHFIFALNTIPSSFFPKLSSFTIHNCTLSLSLSHTNTHFVFVCMAARQLPPKSQTLLPPIMTHQTWNSSPSFHLQTMAPIVSSSGEGLINWPVDHDFADFTWARRNTHRRSASDSVAFLPMLVDDSPPNSSPTAAAVAGFDGLDDEQLMSMLADEMGMRTSDVDPSTPSDDDHDHYLHKQPKEEMSDSTHMNTTISGPATGDTIVDPKRIKRILANRQSARRSRVRKLQYISELERSVTTLQTEVSTLSPRVAFLDHQRLILNVDNSALKQRIAALIQDKLFKDAHQEALKKEIERLRQVYHHQNLKASDVKDG
ncbi:basic leucine zipper 6-like [Impatiens glandulifera]|uniref:basic leucine zipper 6-like n=1 Tax=Impatiens glandulifera TaxID=253017 RepID=UPI001FB195CA|nr:basic leucine zipper 6-like [Impatiens glandulifera]